MTAIATPNSFVVQLKSESVTSIQYQNHELKWFVGQSLPMFIGLVSLANSQLSLYSTLFVNQAVSSLYAKSATLRFGVSGLPPFFRGQRWLPWRADTADAVTVWLGEPILQWAVNDFGGPDWATRAYRVLKRFIAVARRELELLSFGHFSVLDWSTNDADSIASHSGMIKGHPDDLTRLADCCAPCLHAIMIQAVSMPAETGNSLVHSLLTLAAGLRDLGVEIDPENLFGKLFFGSQMRSNKDGTTAGT